jgi:hypothetical protein
VRTPAGTECPFYYQDYFRGRETRECRLIARNPRSAPWAPSLCAGCPVPRIVQVNRCPHLALEARVGKGFLGLTRRVEVSAACTQYLVDVPEPQVGCGHCHEQRLPRDART